MARDEARIKVSIWMDADYRALPRGAKLTYQQLLEQPDMSWCGVVALRVRRWATEQGATVDEVWADLDALQDAGFIAFDRDTEELLVRTFMKHNTVGRIPKVFIRACRDVMLVSSDVIRMVLSTEFSRVEVNIPKGDLGIQVAASRHAATEALGIGKTPVGSPLDRVSDRVSGTLLSGSGSGSKSLKLSNQVVTITSEPADAACPTLLDEIPIEEPSKPEPEPEPVRWDVEELCSHLADRITQNGSRRPTIGKKWHDAARLLLDRDKRDLTEALQLVDWCQANEFWRGNILSMPKFREKYDRLRLQAEKKPLTATAPTSRMDLIAAIREQRARGVV